jgi:hypothetical protein
MHAPFLHHPSIKQVRDNRSETDASGGPLVIFEFATRRRARSAPKIEGPPGPWTPERERERLGSVMKARANRIMKWINGIVTARGLW